MNRSNLAFNSQQYYGMDPIAEALKPVWGELGLTGPESSNLRVQVPYHGAKAVQSAVHAVIAATEANAQRPMVNAFFPL